MKKDNTITINVDEKEIARKVNNLISDGKINISIPSKEAEEQRLKEKTEAIASIEKQQLMNAIQAEGKQAMLQAQKFAIASQPTETFKVNTERKEFIIPTPYLKTSPVKDQFLEEAGEVIPPYHQWKKEDGLTPLYPYKKQQRAKRPHTYLFYDEAEEDKIDFRIDTAPKSFFKKIGETKMTHEEINIKIVNRGFIVRAGCQTIIFENEKDLFKAISEYKKDPEAAEKKYIEVSNDTF